MAEQQQGKTISEVEFCRLVGISRTAAWQFREANKLKFYRVGVRIRYAYPEHVLEFLAQFEGRPQKKERAA